jgi:long-chain fatty acid transport protein
MDINKNNLEGTEMKIRSVLLLSLLNFSIHATNGNQMIGVSAISNSMGGAVIASGLDASSSISNPAALDQLEINEIRMDFGLGFLNPPRKVNDQESDSNLFMIPNGAVALKVSDKLTFGVASGGVAGTGTDFIDIKPTVANNQSIVTAMQMFKFAPGFSYKLSDRFSFGASFHLNYKSVALYNAAAPTTLILPQKREFGTGATLGFLYRFNNNWNLGLSYTTKQNIKDFKWNTSSGKFKMDLDEPSILAAGLMYRISNSQLVEVAVKKIGFADVMKGPILYKPDGSNQSMPFGWDDQWVYIIGYQQIINPKWSVRGSFNYGKSPIEAADVAGNLGSVAVTEKHLSFGVTHSWNKRLMSSISYTKAFENTVEAVDKSNKLQLEQNVVKLQLTYNN